MKSLQRKTPCFVVPYLLPIRTRLPWWQAVSTWLRQGWQRLRTPHLQLQPPLQPARHKPFPQRPHQQRRQVVFAALDAAPLGFTRRQLIAHVRVVTGVGCSEKLISQWRKAQQRDGERGRQGDRETAGKSDGDRWQNNLGGGLLCLGLTACAPTALTPTSPSPQITISPAPSAAPLHASTAPLATPRLLRVKLTLQAASELRVKQGDDVKAGDVLSDHRQARQRLLIQKRALQTAAQHLQTQMRLTNESLRQLQSLGLALPPTTFAAEQAAIKRAETEAIAVQRALATQQERLSVVRRPSSVAFPAEATGLTENGPAQREKQLTTDNRQLTLIQQHEEAKLTQAQDKQLLASAEIELHKAKLATAREVRRGEETKHRVDITRQLLAARSQQQQTEIELARLTAQLAELELQLTHLAAARAPFAGHIKRIEWEEMNDEKLTVVVYLAIGSR